MKLSNCTKTYLMWPECIVSKFLLFFIDLGCVIKCVKLDSYKAVFIRFGSFASNRSLLHFSHQGVRV